MTITDALREAYLRTTYRVTTDGEVIDIRVNERSAPLDRLLQSHGVRDWAFITASNPRSRALPEEENARRNEAMKASLRRDGWTCLNASGVPEQPGWQPERSVLVLGMCRAAAAALATQWEQNAVLVGSLGQRAELVWTD